MQASMNEIQSTMQAYTSAFKDLTVLGVFESNHGEMPPVHWQHQSPSSCCQ